MCALRVHCVARARATVQVSVHYTSGFNYIVNVRQSAQLATALGHADNATQLSALAASLATDFHAAWFHAASATYDDGRPTSYALALFTPGIVPAAMHDTIADGLLNAVVPPPLPI